MPRSRFVANAFVMLGRYYLVGIPDTAVMPSPELARRMFAHAASYFGDPEAQYQLAQLYLDGNGVERDPTADDVAIEKATHRLIARVSDEFERWSYNTAVASFMEFVNLLSKYVQQPDGPRRDTLSFAVDQMLLLLAPMAPHVTAELWERRHGGHVHEQPWPTADPAMVEVDTVTMVVQVNGKVRDRIEVNARISEADAVAAALASPKVVEVLGGAAPKRVVARPPKLVNVVV